MTNTTPLRWTIESRINYPLISETTPSPDGRLVAYVVRETLLTDDKSEFITQIFLAPVNGNDARQLTFGEARNTAPRWSPDSRHLAFLSTRTGRLNLYVMRADGGEAWPLTRFDQTDVVDVRWSPDGSQIAFLMAEPPSDEKQKARKAKDDAVQFDVDFDFVHLYTVPFSVAPRTLPVAQQITRGRFHVVAFDWLLDGARFAITHRPSPVADCWRETRLATIPTGGATEQPDDVALLADHGPIPMPSPDGRWIACVTGDQPARWAYASHIVLYPTDGSPPRVLADTPDQQPMAVGWAADSARFLALETAGVTSQLLALPVSGAPAEPLTDTPLMKFAPSANGHGLIAFAGHDFTLPNAVYALDLASRTTRQLAQPPLPPEWPDAPLPHAEVIRWTAPDGRAIEGILTRPSTAPASGPLPLIVEIHGGPTGVYTRSYLGQLNGYADIAGLSERGYATLRVNPRGSSGYGREFRQANIADWGGGDYRDIMAGVDGLIAQGIADPDRLGILGWSYGGFMTSWTITQTRRFQAACVGAGLTDPVSFNGTSDIASFVPDYFGAESWDDPDAYRRQSPLLNVKGVTTPTLIQHGDQDVRVPLGQGREFHNALKRQGVPVEMVIYPRQGHGLAEPRLIMDARRRTIEWFERWIRVKND